MVEKSHPQTRNIGEIPFLGYIWILGDSELVKKTNIDILEEGVTFCDMLHGTGNNRQKTTDWMKFDSNLISSVYCLCYKSVVVYE